MKVRTGEGDQRSKGDDLIDPRSKLRDARVDTRLIGQGTANAPGNDANQLPSIAILVHKWSTRVTFARVLGSLGQACADEDAGDLFDVACLSVHGLAFLVRDDRHLDMLQGVRQRTVFVQPAPACDDGLLADVGFI